MKILNQKINADSPTRYLKRCKDHGHDITNPCVANNAARRVPITDGHEQSHRRGDNGEKPENKNNERQNGKRQRNAIVQRSPIFQALDFALRLPCLETWRTEMFPIQFTVAQSAHKTAATLAREHSFFAGMVKTSRLALAQYDFAAPGRSSPAKQSGENFDLQQALASRTWLQAGLIEHALDERRSALGT